MYFLRITKREKQWAVLAFAAQQKTYITITNCRTQKAGHH